MNERRNSDNLEEIDWAEPLDDRDDVIELGGEEPHFQTPPKPNVINNQWLDADLPAHDRDFLVRVFAQVRDVDLAKPPPPTQGRTQPQGLDKKLTFLRERVRELEYEMARIARIWAFRQEQFAHMDDIIGAKEQARVTAEERYEHIKDQGVRSAQQHRREVETQKRLFDDLQAQYRLLEEKMQALQRSSAEKEQQLQAEKETLAADYKRNLYAAEESFNDLRAQSTEIITSVKHKLEEAYKQIADWQEKLEKAEDSQRRLTERLQEREKMMAMLTEELAGTRKHQEERILELKEMLASKDEKITALAGAKPPN